MLSVLVLPLVGFAILGAERNPPGSGVWNSPGVATGDPDVGESETLGPIID